MQHDDKAAAKRQKKFEEWDRLDQFERDSFINAMMQRRDGRRYMYWLLEITNAIGQNAFTGHALTTAFECGQQNVGQRIMANLIDVNPDGFLMMLKESADERTERSKSTAPAAGESTESSTAAPSGYEDYDADT